MLDQSDDEDDEETGTPQGNPQPNPNVLELRNLRQQATIQAQQIAAMQDMIN